jgi:hypothetical protein
MGVELLVQGAILDPIEPGGELHCQMLNQEALQKYLKTPRKSSERAQQGP